MGATISSAGDGGGIASSFPPCNPLLSTASHLLELFAHPPAQLKPPVRSAGFALDEATLDGLEVSTYFDREEIVALYWAFNVTSNSEKFISKERFVEAFPSFTSPLVVDALFRAVGADGNCRIDFTCFLRALSVTCRGTPEEKLKLAFRVMDLDNNGVVSVEETRAVASEFGAILQYLGQSESRFGTPSKVVESIFKYQDAQEMDRMRSWVYKLKRRKALKQFEKELAEEDKDQVAKNKTIISDMLRQAHGDGLSRWSVALQLVREKAKHEMDKMRRMKRKAIKRRKDDESAMMKSLSWKNFAKRAINDPNFYQCFGLFDYMHSIILAPIEARLNPDGQKPIEGILEVAYKGKVSFGRPKLSKRYCVCNGQFLGIYSRHWDRRERPKRVVSLQYASIITTSAVKPAFRIVAPGFSGLFVAPSFSDRKEWVTAVRRNVPRVNPYASFAQPRVAVAARPLIDGKEYFSDLYSAISGATSRILITGWFFIPTLYLIRADPLNPNHRLDNLLLRKAKEGVHIYILIWNETRLAYPLNSGKITSYLENLHPRIRAIRHPGLFPLSWSHHQKSVVIDDVIAYVGGLDLAWGRYDDENYRLFDPEGQIWPSNDYSNLIISRTENGSLRPESTLDRAHTPRMPWHDVAVRIEGQAAWDAARNFIQRWNHARFTTNSVRRLTCPYLMPTDLPNAGVSFDFLDHHRSLDLNASAPISRAASLSSPALPPPPPSPSCTVQVLRSISPWSAGVAVPEDSIYKAMIDLITHAKHFIYIENQYFISSTIGVSPVPRNKVALALLERLRRAIGLREKFRVVIVLPLFPAGNLTDLATRYVLKWVYTTVNRKGDSLLRLLEAEFPEVDINNYISFFNLRTWGKLGDKYCTHQIYVHSKLLIVDDRYALIGSANINDRSLCGDRDSELSVLLSDSQQVATVMAGRPFMARKEVLQLRLRLWQRLLGLGSDAASLARLQDPVSDDVYLTLWRKRAESNSRIYRTVFAHIEDNTERLEDWKPLSWATEDMADAAKPEEHTQCNLAECFSLAHIKGFVVEHTMILSASRLHPHIWEKEFFLQVDTFI